MSDTHTYIPQLNLLNLPQLQAIKQQIDSLIKQGGAEPLHLPANVNLAQLADVAQQVQTLKRPGQSEPGEPARESFPVAPGFKVEPDGAVTGEPEKPTAADARRDGDGKNLALQKVIAGLFGGIADNRHVKIAAAGVLVFAVLALLAGYLFVEHRRQLAPEQPQLAAEETQFQEQQRTNADTKALVEKLFATSRVQVAPGAERAVRAAVDAAAQGAAAGDARWQRALALLHAGNVEEAEPLFRAVADEKVARISQDKKDAVAAYRNLGAIAGLAHPKRAREAYAQAVALDPDDREAPSGSSNRIGNVQVAQGDLAGARARVPLPRERTRMRCGRQRC
jgi:hypothetical protein